jgi:hypothetical protein
MKMNIGKWMYELYGNEIWEGEEFDTKEDAIKAAKEELGSQEMKQFMSSFKVGQIAEVSICGVDVDSILENVAENTADEVGEVGDEYLCDVEREHAEELEEKLNKVLFDWIKKHGYEPGFFKIENEETISIEGDSLENNDNEM